MNGDKLEVNGDLCGVGVAQDGSVINQNIIVPERKIQKQLTSKLGKSTIIGREKELKEIDERLKASNTLLIKGIGGVGKSTIASNYIHRHKDEYDYYGFFEGLESFESELEGAFELEIEQGQDRFDRVLRELIKLEPMSKKLLVIDDVKEIKENQEKLEKILGLEHNGYRVLLTSRFKVKNVNIYPLPTLNPQDAQKLFVDNYKTEELEKVNKILEYLDYHPLFVELVAKTIENEDSYLDEIIEQFELGKLAKIEFRDDDDEGNVTSFNTNLQKLFEMQKKSLTDEYLLLLKQLAILPSINIKLSFLKEIFGRKLKSRLNFLVNQGWLIEGIDGYKLHQLVKVFFLANHPPYFEEIENIIDYFLSYEIKAEEWITNYLESIVSSCKRCEIKDKKIRDLSRLLGEKYYDDLANRGKSKIHLEYAKKIYIEVGEEIHPDIYHRLGAIDNNLEYLEKALFEYEKENNKKQRTICLSDIGTWHWDEGLLDEALLNFKKELELLEENDFTYLAINYNQQSLVYKDKRDIDKAFEYQFKAVDLIKKAREYDDSWFNKKEQAQFINNLGELYMDETEEFDLALEYIRKSLDLREQNLYKEHERFGESYDNLAIIKEKIGDFHKAYEYQLKAIQIWEKSPPERDSYLENAKERFQNLKAMVLNPK